MLRTRAYPDPAWHDLAMTDVPVQPGDWAVVSTGARFGWLITLGERIAMRGRRTQWDHAVIATGWKAGTLMIVEAVAKGAVEVPWHYEDRPHKWSSGIIDGKAEAAAAALKYASPGPGHPGGGVGYSYLDYWAIALHSLGLSDPGLQRYIASTGHMICSQLVDQSCQDADEHLFTDPPRWPGYVMPPSLGELLGV